jgi:hypothetical protein
MLALTEISGGNCPLTLSLKGIVSNAITTVALIGSFRHIMRPCFRLDGILSGLIVTSPTGTSVIEEGIPLFVLCLTPRLGKSPDSNRCTSSNNGAHFVYVVAPQAMGKTTCYEIGRLLQAKQPLYFSSYLTIYQ